MMLSAGNAIDNNQDSFAHTEMGRDHWWYADFDTTREVTEVRILNRRDCCGERLRGSTVHIGNTLCGTLPDTTATATQYTVTCATPLRGSSITIRQNTTFTALQLATVEVWGFDNCTHDEKENSWGAHKCRTANDCEGARSCSRWQWCTGETACPAASPPAERSPYVVTSRHGSRVCHSSYTEDNLDKENEMTTAAQCGAKALENGCQYFHFSPHAASRGCHCCTSMSSHQSNSYFTIYEMVANLP